MDSQEQRIYAASEAARLLEASESATRRYAALYEAMHGPMPRDKQKRRLWTHEALSAMRDTKALVHSHKVASIQAELEAIGEAARETVELSPTNPSDYPLREMLARLESVERLEGEIKLLRRQVDTPSKRESELEQMNSYLMRELERYQQQAEAAPADPLSLVKRMYRWLYRK